MGHGVIASYVSWSAHYLHKLRIADDKCSPCSLNSLFNALVVLAILFDMVLDIQN